VADPIPALVHGAVDRLTTAKGGLYLLGQLLAVEALPAAAVRDRLAAVDRELDAVLVALRRLEEAAAAELVGLQEQAAVRVADLQEEAAAEVALRQEATAAAL